MTQRDGDLQVRLIVHTSDGDVTSHEYPNLSDSNQAADQLDRMSSSIFDGMAGRTATVLLRFPFVVYNPAHIVRIEVDPDREMPAEVHEKMGFQVPTTPAVDQSG